MQPKKMNASILYITVLFILVSVGLVFFLRSGFFSIREVKINGLINIPEGEIQKLAGQVLGQNIFLFDQSVLSRRIKFHPLVLDVSFQRKLPSTLIAKITERTPSALVLVPKGVIEVDSQGVFLRRLESWPNNDYPVISGVDISESAGPGQNISDPALTSVLFMLSQAPGGLLPLIGEVHINTIQQISLFLTSGVEVRLGKAEDWQGKLAALFELLNDESYQSFQSGVRYIDYTAAKPVIGR
ncbi:MAG TPA: FtsQ-type POTRA domain-containing protein [Desulfitobacteriaceae bacterium]|nr:FtsQ-type POTRA domain-containing protein [Desulfitobacteriaceae bacterium]